MHPTDTEHKRPWGTDGERVTPDAIMVRLSTNLSLYYKSHVHSFPSVNYQFKGGQHVTVKGTVNKTVSVLQSFFHVECFVAHWVALGGNHQQKYCMSVSLSPPVKTYIWEQTLKELYWRQWKMRAQRNSHFIWLSSFARSLKFLVMLQMKVDANASRGTSK